MRLEMRSFRVRDALFGAETTFDEDVLTVNVRELRDVLFQDTNQFESVDIALAKPGEKSRIIHVLDAIEPRVKVGEGTSAFPGFLGLPYRAGNGITCRLAGMAVLTCAEFPEYDPHSTMGATESIIDMSGYGARLSPFSNIINLALVFQRRKGATTAGFSSAIRMAGLKAASYLAETVKDANKLASEVSYYSLEVDNGKDGLPRVGVVYLLSSVSLPLRESFAYGHPVGGILPTMVDPNEVLDGAVVDNHFTHAGVRKPTYFYQNCPVLQELYQHHGRDFNLVAAILTWAGSTSDVGKLNEAARAAGLAELMSLDGIIVSGSGGGHNVMDFMYTCWQFEERGIKVVGIIAEMANVDGADFGFPAFVPEADALISTGNREEPVHLPPMEAVIGGEKLLGEQVWAGTQLKVPLRNVYCSSTQAGAWNISAKAF